MLLISFGLLCAAALLGGALAVRYLKGPAAAPSAIMLGAHAAFGIASLVVLVAVLRRGLPHTGMGTAGFGSTAAILLALALAQALPIARAVWRGQRPKELLVGTHAGLAIAGFVMLLTLIALG